MKRWMAILLIAGITTACSRQVPAETSVAEPAQPRASNFVIVSEKAQKESGIATEKTRLQAVPEVVRSTARITNDENRTWRVGAITDGRVVNVLANAGDIVTKEQTLAEIHSHDIHESRALYMKAKADLARMKGVEEFATRVRDRAKRLYDLKAGSLEQLERTETELRNAQTDVSNAQIEVDRTRNHLTEFLGIPAELMEAHAEGQEDHDLIPVRSPADGVVLSRNVTPGTVVTPSIDMFLVSDLGKLWAMAEVQEEFLAKLRVGMPVRVFVQAYPNEAFAGRIGKLGEALDPATRTVKVRVEMSNPRGRLKPEMYASTEIEVGKAEPAVVVPVDAIQDVRGQSVVFVKTAPDRFEMHPVRTGRTAGTLSEILAGLNPGEEVAVRAAFILKSEFLKATLAQ